MGSILIVDDDEAVRSALADAATHLGHEVQTAQDGREALALFERERFDCVVTDLAMPEVDGLTLLRRIKRRRPGTGVLIITGHSTVELVAASVNMGADAYVTKPFRIAELDEQLHRVLGEGREAARAAPSRLGMAALGWAVAATLLAILGLVLSRLH